MEMGYTYTPVRIEHLIKIIYVIMQRKLVCVNITFLKNINKIHQSILPYPILYS